MAAPPALGDELSICIKHTPQAARRTTLRALVESIRGHAALARVAVLVASEAAKGTAHHQFLHALGVRVVGLEPDAGLSAGRNECVRRVHTPFVALLDDDTLVHDGGALATLVRALRDDPTAALAGGCYEEFSAARAREALPEELLRHELLAERGRRRRLDAPLLRRRRVGGGGCRRVHATHNFFVGRTAALRRFGWDPRQRMMEHETFFYQLYLNRQPVLACPSATVRHNVTHDQTYDATSFRKGEKNREQLQFWCKDFPEVRTLTTPYWTWRCAARRACQPRWESAFPFDGSFCEEMLWDASDDASRVLRPLVAPYHDAGRFPYVGGGGGGGGERRVPLLVLVLSQPSRTERREWQRRTWLSFPWRGGQAADSAAVDYDLVPWRHAYVYPHRRRGNASGSLLMGDAVSVDVARGRLASAAEEEPLALAAVRWAVAHVAFEWLLCVDDDAMVHVGRMWRWLGGRGPELFAPLPPRRCGGASSAAAESFVVGRGAARRLLEARRTVDALPRKPRDALGVLAARASLVAAADAPAPRDLGCGGVGGAAAAAGEVVLQRVSAKGRPREAMRELVHDAGRRSWPEEAFVNCEACKWWLERRDNRTAPHAAAAHVGARVGKAAHPVLRAKSTVAKVPVSGAP